MTSKTEGFASKTQVRYVSVVFDSSEETSAKTQNLISELDVKLKNRLEELKSFAKERLKQDLVNNEIHAISNYNLRMDYLNSYQEQTKGLKKLLFRYSSIPKSFEFLSKNIIKNHGEKEFLTEGGYPNDQFRMELLARVIKTLDTPNDLANQKQLNLIHTILPEKASSHFFIVLGIIALIFLSLALASVIVGTGPAAIFPLALTLTMLVGGTLASSLSGGAALCIEESQRSYQKYKNSVPGIAKSLQFFSKDAMEHYVVQSKGEDVVGPLALT